MNASESPLDDRTTGTKKTNTKKKVIGIIGGSGPEAGADLFQKVLAKHRAKLGSLYKSDRDAPDIVLASSSGLGGPRTAMDIQPNQGGTYEESLEALVDSVQKIAQLADVVCLACNTLHVFEPQIRDTLRNYNYNYNYSSTIGGSRSGEEDRSPSRKVVFVSMIAATIEACKARLGNSNRNNNVNSNINTNSSIDSSEGARIAILGGPITMDLHGNSSYRRIVQELGEDTIYVLPPPATIVLQRLIWQIKEDGTPPTSASHGGNECDAGNHVFEAYKDLLRDLLLNHNVTMCVLACTELPLIDVRELGEDIAGSLEFLDPTEVVAEAVLEATQSY